MPRPDLSRFPPVPDEPRPFPTEPPLEVALADLSEWWLDMPPCCGLHIILPLRRLAADHGWQTPLKAILPRLCCEKCGKRPDQIFMADDPQRGEKVTYMPAQQRIRVWG